MIAHIPSLSFCGIEITDVDVQVKISNGIPAFSIVGMAHKTIDEARQRVRAAFSSIGLGLPAKKILVNLAPSDLIKEGSHFDLPIACGLLCAMNILPPGQIKDYMVIGELSLDGSILPVSGTLPSAIGAAARSKGIICPAGNKDEASWSGNPDIIAPSSLLELVNHFKGTQIIPPPSRSAQLPDQSDVPDDYTDMSDICGQEGAKRVLEIAAAGGHHLLMSGSPGSGKSMLAQRMPGILPAMSAEEILECSTISSVAGLIEDGKLTTRRPFRAPHHSCSMPAMVGGGVGRRIKPGEVSLAHNGVLFLDEMPEFPSSVIESLRQPIENNEVLISRSGVQARYPANFQLVAAMNPCKCGYLYDQQRSCARAPKCGGDYQMKISGPMLDRFDMHIQVNDNDQYHDQIVARASGKKSDGETSKEVAARVLAARKIQAARYEGCGVRVNGGLSGDLLIEYCLPVDEGGRTALSNAANKFRFSARAYNRVLRVARTIADLAGEKNVYKSHVLEALSYRELDFAFLR